MVHRPARATLLAAAFITLLLAPVRADELDNPYADRLRQHGIEPTGEAVLAYLDHLRPTPERSEEIAGRIGQLNAPLHIERERAAAYLVEFGLTARPQLEEATGSDIAEIAYRARQLHQKLLAGNPETVLLAAIEVLRIEKPDGSAERILGVAPLCQTRYARFVAQRALTAVTGPDEVGRLRRALAHEPLNVRLVAIPALASHLGPEGAVELLPLLDDGEPAVRLATACALADLGIRDVLGTFLDLMSDDDVDVRGRAHTCLQALTGRQFGYVAYADDDERAEAIAGWARWLDEHGPTAPLHIPLTDAHPDTHLRGRMLISQHDGVKILNEDRSVVWRYRVAGPMGAEMMANGNILVAAQGGRKVMEVTPSGQVAWEYTVQARRASPLPNGNILIADAAGTRVIEVAKENNEIVWEHQTQLRSHAASRLPNGNTLITTQRKVEEVTPAGEVVWEWEGGINLSNAQRLNNGNTLVADHRRVVELSPEKEAVWEFNTAQVFDAVRLPNGHTLIASDSRIIKVAQSGRIVWEQSGLRFRSARK